MPKEFDIIVAGAGHAGIEAALSGARMGLRVALLTQNLDTIGLMSCNPAIGGIGKGHIVCEIDALGGEMGINADATGIQFRQLNKKKGPSVQAPRVQSDKKNYQKRLKYILENTDNISIYQFSVDDIIVKNSKICGVICSFGIKFYCKTLVLTTGTFLRGLLHVGKKNISGGRMGDSTSSLSSKLSKFGFTVNRFKTGTPCRLNGRSIDYSRCKIQDGDPDLPRFSPILEEKDCIYYPNQKEKMFHVEQIPCWLTNTNAKTHEIILNNLDKSPMYSGIIKGIGPRYCPSIEDKVVRFKEKEKHLIFLEPEGPNTNEYYLNGMSTSLPFEVQEKYIRSISGLENAEIIRPGYAVEYDYFNPIQLYRTLETKLIENLFFAGQINGTSGYEEAAAQGLVAGINAGCKINKLSPFILERNESYIGVLIDDLTTKGVTEPYRMFTSRAEYRLSLRNDNVDFRLTQKAKNYGLITEERSNYHNERRKNKEELIKILKESKTEGKTLYQHLKSKDFYSKDLPKEIQRKYDTVFLFHIETEIKYEGYIARERKIIDSFKNFQKIKLSNDINYFIIKELKREAREILTKIKPDNLEQASRISGITPADISILRIWLEKQNKI